MDFKTWHAFLILILFLQNMEARKIGHMETGKTSTGKTSTGN